MGCECFDPRVSAVNIQKGFEKSFVSGVKAVVRVGKDLLARGKELSGANFSQNYEIVGGRLHWEGDEHPVEYHLRRYTAWLIGRGASPDLVLRSKLDRQVFKQVQEAALQLRDGMTINWLSFKTTNPSDGAAFHQLAMVNGKLVQRSRLLPFEDADQMSRLVTVMSQNRDDLSVATDDGLSPLLGWVTMGKAVDFDKELPGMIRESLSVNQQDLGMPIHTMTESMSGGVGVGVGYVHLGSVHGEVSVTEVPVYAPSVVVTDVQPHPRGGVEVVALKPMTDHQVEKYQEHKSVKVIRETITEGMGVTESTAKVVVPAVTRMIPVNEVIEDTVSHLRGVIVAGDEDMEMAEELVGKHNFREYKSVKGVKVGDTEVIMESLPVGGQVEVTESTEKVVVPTVTRLIPVGDETRVAALQPVANRQVVEEVITENTEVTEDTVSHLRGVINMELPRYEIGELPESVVQPHPRGGVEVVADNDVHLGSGHGPKEEVITEGIELAEGTEKLELRKRKFSAFSFNSVSSVIKETFDKKLAERKSVKSVKEKIAWLQRQIANVVADQLIGRNTDEPVLGWLVHGWAMMQFDGIEEKQKMKRFSLSPVRIWADRVTRVARRVKDKFVRTGFSVYKQLFAAI